LQSSVVCPDTTRYRRATVLHPRFGEDRLRLFDFCGGLGVNRDEEVARLDLAFIAFGFDLDDAQAG
jgi:hypothetical protein